MKINEDNYEWALKRIEELMQNDPQVHTKEGVELIALAEAVERYEREIVGY